MKKIYLQPRASVELMVAERMIAASETLPVDSDTIVNPSDADSRLFPSFDLPINPFE